MESRDENKEYKEDKEDNGKIIEGRQGGYKYPEEKLIPEDAKLFFSTSSYEFYHHKDKKGKIIIYIKIANYHAGQLKIPLSKLEEMISYIKEE